MPDDLKDIAFSVEHLKTCKGYDPKFIDGKTNIPTGILSLNQKKQLPSVSGAAKGLLNYSFFSVAYSSKRKLPFFSASNIDASKKNENTKRANGFSVDPRVKTKYQLDNGFYDLEKNFTEFEIGHMASNDEMSWGATDDEAQLSAYESFHFPNSVPQAERLNSGLWRSLEQYIIKEGGNTINKKISVFTGPVLAKRDPVYINDKTFQVPLLFWKVIVFKWKDQLWCTGFIMSHEKRLRDDLKILIYPKAPQKFNEKPDLFKDYKYKQVFQVNLSLVEKHTGLKFKWQNVKRLKIPTDALQLKKISDTGSVDDIEKNAGKKKKVGKLNMVLPGK
jgi:endonuclease G